MPGFPTLPNPQVSQMFQPLGPSGSSGLAQNLANALVDPGIMAAAANATRQIRPNTYSSVNGLRRKKVTPEKVVDMADPGVAGPARALGRGLAGQAMPAAAAGYSPDQIQGLLRILGGGGPY